MRKKSVLLCLTLAAAGLASAAPPQLDATTGRHVLLVSIDGLRPDFYLNPQEHGAVMPTLQSMMRRGAYAEGVIGSYPSVTYPSHTTMVTGVRPARHGILNNYVFDPRGRFYDWYWNAEAIRAPTLWDAARANGGQTAAVSWPVTVGSSVDLNFPEFWIPGSRLSRREQMAQVMEPALLEAIERAVGPLTDDRFEDEALETLLFEVASFLVRTHQPRLLLLHVYNTDSAQHRFGREGREVAAAFEADDRKLGELLRVLAEAGLDSKTLVVVTGDHGFFDVHSLIHLNAALAKAGFIELGAGGAIERWRAMGWPAGGACAIVLADPEDAATRQEVETFVGDLLRGPMGGILHRVDRGELDALGAMPDAAVVLEAVEGYHFGRGLTGDVIAPSIDDRGHHGFLPYGERMRTGFLMAGPGVRANVRVPIMRQVDIAPTIAAWAGWNLPQTDGIALRGLFK